MEHPVEPANELIHCRLPAPQSQPADQPSRRQDPSYTRQVSHGQGMLNRTSGRHKPAAHRRAGAYTRSQRQLQTCEGGRPAARAREGGIQHGVFSATWSLLCNTAARAREGGILHGVFCATLGGKGGMARYTGGHGVLHKETCRAGVLHKPGRARRATHGDTACNTGGETSEGPK